MAKESIKIVIDVDMENGKITAHAEGIKSKTECLKAIMDVVEGLVEDGLFESFKDDSEGSGGEEG
jgi:uncharacterized protein YegP (UPF0339 family)